MTVSVNNGALSWVTRQVVVGEELETTPMPGEPKVTVRMILFFWLSTEMDPETWIFMLKTLIYADINMCFSRSRHIHGLKRESPLCWKKFEL